MKYIYTLLLLCITIGLQAQNKGQVQDENGKGIGFATVQILDAKDSSLVTGTITDDEGKYEITEVKAGKYLLQVSFVGYQTKTMLFQPGTIPTIILKEITEQLAEVEVTGKKPLIERLFDKVVLNVSSAPFAVGSNGSDLLRRAPGVNIDKDGNVTVNGKSVEVYIDGRPSYLSGDQLKTMLETTDGSTIEKIEIITNPSAKYEAAGAGGIINIKTKKNMTKGLNGSLSASYGGMYFKDVEAYNQTERASLMLNYRSPKTYTNLRLTQMYGDNMDQSETGNTMTIDGEENERYSYSLSKGDIQYYQLKLGNDWFIDKKNTFGVIFQMPIFKIATDIPPEQSYSYTLRNKDTTSYSVDQRRGRMDNTRYSGNLNYTHIFADSLDREITVNLDYNRMNRNQDKHRLTTYRPVKSIDYKDLTDKYVDIYSAKVDFQTNFWKQTGMIEAGGKWSLTKTNNAMQIDSLLNSSARPTTHSDFDFTEHIGALYITVSKKFDEHWSAKLGLRGEFSHSLGDWISADSSTLQHYFKVFPSVFVGYNPTDKWSIGVSYTRRIQRPNYKQLNPFIQYSDAYSYSMGNPDLKPQIMDAISLQGGYSQYVSLEVSYVHAQDVFSQHLEALPGGLTKQTYGNYGTVHICDVNLSLTELPLVPKFSTDTTGHRSVSGAWLALTVYGGYSFMNLIDEQWSGDEYAQKAHTGNLYFRLSAYLKKDWNLAFDGWWSSPQKAADMEFSGNLGLNVSVQKRFKKPNLTLNVQWNDMLRSSNYELRSKRENMTSFDKVDWFGQSVTIGLAWNFGKQQYVKQRKVGEVDEISRFGSSDKR